MTDKQDSVTTGMPEIDRLVHEPARLAILTVLAACERADFLFLERTTGLTRGNLSVQLSRLEEAGLIEIKKTIERKRTLTTAALVRHGREAMESYWLAMEDLRARSQAAAASPTATVDKTGDKASKPARGTTAKPATASS